MCGECGENGGGRSEFRAGWGDQERLLKGGGSDRKEVGSPPCPGRALSAFLQPPLKRVGGRGIRTFSVTELPKSSSKAT